ncbi:unnamed protein product [Linum tenue]|uniref:Uncharacterized protein n=1 Tax=Linum tenue TaxID=586396 RepID=A0AAV0L7A3_9ROSI|nr:unnamed protein product [Linum tenue]
MVLFDFKSDKHFVASSDKATLKVYQLTNPTAVNPSSIGKNHWKEVATITARDQDQSNDEEQDDGDDPSAEEEEEESYDGLMFFNGHGRIEGQEALTKLAQHLTRLQLRINPQGFCFQDVTRLGEHKEFGFHYLRLNDLFNWPYHGIRMPGIATWRRLVLEYSVPKGEKRPKAGGAVSKKKYEELKKMIEERDEKMLKLREEMEEQDWELEKLKEEREKHEQELRDLEKKNGKELLKLSKKKEGELETLKREKDEELEDKTEELETLRKEKDDEAKSSKGKNEELKKLREEVRNLKRAQNDEGGGAAAATSEGKIMVDSDEWHKLKNDEAEMREEVANKDEALRKVMNEKDAESQRLRIEKEEMMKASAAETEKLRNQLLRLPRKQSWLQTAATKLVPLTTHNDQIISTRRAVPQDTWSLSREIISGSFQYNSLVNNFYWPFSSANGLSLVDEDPRDWLPPPKIRVYNGRAAFDKDNWWFVKTTHPDGGLTMMAYYDGGFHISNLPGMSCSIRLPYSWDNSPFWGDTACTLAMVSGEYKLAFIYRE